MNSLKCFKKHKNSTEKRGFTLIELMVAISIIAVLSAVGLVAFTSAQRTARDAKRKQDLRSISTALQLYYQDNQTYPTTLTTSKSSGKTVTDWIGNGDLAGTYPSLVPKYIDNLPIDPLKMDVAACGGPTSAGCFGYTYWSGSTAGYGGECPQTAGQFFILVAHLENKNDPDRSQLKKPRWCDGQILGGHSSPGAYYKGWGDDTFIITSNN